MTDLRKAAEMALEVFDGPVLKDATEHAMRLRKACDLLRQALAQPEQDASSWRVRVNEAGWCEVIEYGPAPDGQKITPIYTTPPKREWVGLTHEEKDQVDKSTNSVMTAIFLTEQKLMEKNGG